MAIIFAALQENKKNIDNLVRQLFACRYLSSFYSAEKILWPNEPFNLFSDESFEFIDINKNIDWGEREHQSIIVVNTFDNPFSYKFPHDFIIEYHFYDFLSQNLLGNANQQLSSNVDSFFKELQIHFSTLLSEKNLEDSDSLALSINIWMTFNLCVNDEGKQKKTQSLEVLNLYAKRSIFIHYVYAKICGIERNAVVDSASLLNDHKIDPVFIQWDNKINSAIKKIRTFSKSSSSLLSFLDYFCHLLSKFISSMNIKHETRLHLKLAKLKLLLDAKYELLQCGRKYGIRFAERM